MHVDERNLYPPPHSLPGGSVRDKDFVISNVQAGSVDNNSAVITWATNRNTDSYVEYGTSINYGSLEGNNTPTTSHSIRLVNLVSGTDYNFRIKVSESGGTSYSQNYSFKTTGEQSSGSSSQSSTSDSTNPTNTPSPTTANPTTQLTQQGATIASDTETSNDTVSEQSGFEEEATPGPTGAVAGAFSNEDNNWKIAAVLTFIGTLLLSIVLYVSKGYWLKPMSWHISQVFKRFRR